MKNLLLTGLFGSMVAVSCSTANQAQSARNDNYSLKGTWQITNVDYDKTIRSNLSMRELILIVSLVANGNWFQTIIQGLILFRKRLVLV